jgi:hypothetical protein
VKATTRMTILVSVLVALAPSVFAQTLKRAARSHGGTVGGMVGQTRRDPEDGARRKVIGLDTADSAFLIAAAGSVRGANGTFFRSDVTIINHRSVAQEIAVGWIAQGVDNSARALLYDTIPANTPKIYLDFVGTALGTSGLGAVLVTGVNSAGDFDSAALLTGFSRIWTPQPNATGTVSQGFPSVSALDSLGSTAAVAAGLRHDSAYRGNVGIVNLDDVSHTWTIGINGLNGAGSFTMTVLPISMNQQAVPPGNYGDCLFSFQTTGTGFWSAYGAAADNITGDGWASHAFQP